MPWYDKILSIYSLIRHIPVNIQGLGRGGSGRLDCSCCLWLTCGYSRASVMVLWFRRCLFWGCLFSSLLHHSSSFCSFHPRSRSYSPSSLSSLHAEFVDRVSLENWAVFISSSLSLDGKPGFTAVTGETGSGKSMIVKALEYCAGKKKASPLYLFTKPTSHTSSLSSSSVSSPVVSTRVDITLKPHELVTADGETVGIRSDRVYSRVITANSSGNFSYSGNRNSKSMIEIDGKRSTAKAMSSELSEKIRFWPGDIDRMTRESSSGNSKRDLKGTKYLQLLDRIVRKQNPGLLPKIATVYRSWKESNNELIKLEKVRDKMSNENEFELLSFYITEYDSFEQVNFMCHVHQLRI